MDAKALERPAIKLWRFRDAPEEYKRLSDHGGDEDWLAYVPHHYIYGYEEDTDDFGMLEHLPFSEQKFGCCRVSRHTINGRDIVLIGAHA